MNDFLKTAGAVLGTVAPLLARAIGGPLAGTAVGMVCSALGLAPDTPPDQVATAVKNATPDQLLALKNADNAFQEHMADLKLEPDRLDQTDRSSARSQTVDLAKAGSALAWGAPLISTLVLGSFGAVLYAVLTKGLPAGSETIATTMLGTLSAMSTAVVSYWVGSSIGSASKNSLLFNSTPAPATPAGGRK